MTEPDRTGAEDWATIWESELRAMAVDPALREMAALYGQALLNTLDAAQRAGADAAAGSAPAAAASEPAAALRDFWRRFASLAGNPAPS